MCISKTIYENNYRGTFHPVSLYSPCKCNVVDLHYFVSQIVKSVINTLLGRVKRLKELSKTITKLYGTSTKITTTPECCKLPFESLRYNYLFENWVRNVELLQTHLLLSRNSETSL